MAKLRHNSPTGNEQIDESDFVQCNQQGQSRTAGLEHSRVRCSPRKKAAKSYRDLDESSGEEPDRGVKLLPKTIPKSTSQGKQIRLAPLNALSASRSLTQGIGPGIPSFGSQGLAKRSLPEQARPTPRRKAAERPKVFGAAGSSDDSFEIEIEESFWCGSHTSSDDSEEALLSPRKFLAFPRSCKDESKTLPTNSETNLSFRLDNLTLSGQRDLPNASQTTAGLSIPLSRPSSSSYKENHTAFVRFSPPRLHSPSKTRQDRPVTPPQSPSKPRLQSPSKTKSRVPTPPLRQSLDGFWNVDTVNDWNDQYSPKKVLKSPKKLQFIRDDASTSPTSSIQKCQSPYKRNRAELAAKKKFESMKHEVAEDFLAELDAVITSGKIKQLAGTTGGVRFLWSKTLNSTAGRANWRKETTKTRQSDGTTETTYRHHASIELAEKVIDDENRLLNVIAHEFCHLANFMVSGIKDQPHGRQFKEWGRVCTKAFGMYLHFSTEHQHNSIRGKTVEIDPRLSSR